MSELWIQPYKTFEKKPIPIRTAECEIKCSLIESESMKKRNCNSDRPTGKAFQKPAGPAAFADDNERANWVLETVSKMDPGIFPNYQSFELACVLVASSIVGPYAERIAKMLDYPIELVSEWGKNLETNGIWRDGKVRDEGWFHPKSGYTGFIADSLVAQGLLEVIEDPAGGPPKYRARPGTYSYARELLKPDDGPGESCSN